MSPVSLRQDAPSDLRRQWLRAVVNRVGVGDKPDPWIMSLLTLLESLKWQGSPRKLVEALPYNASDLDLEDFRDILARLGFQTRPVDSTIAELSPRLMPCFYVNRRGMPSVAMHADDETTVFDSEKGGLESLGERRRHGKVFVVKELPKQRDAIASDRVSTWLREIIRHFRELLVKTVILSVMINILALSVPIAIMMIYAQYPT
jgi:ATP-binding cassette, subfamily C, bacterial LapB